MAVWIVGGASENRTVLKSKVIIWLDNIYENGGMCPESKHFFRFAQDNDTMGIAVNT